MQPGPHDALNTKRGAALDTVNTIFRSKTRAAQALVAAGAAQLAANRRRWALWAPVALGGGIALYFSLDTEPPLGWAVAALAAAAAGARALRRREGALALMFGVMLVALGFTVAGFRTWSVAAPVIAERTGPVFITGEVARLEVLDGGQRLTLAHPRISRLPPGETPAAVRVKLLGAQPAIRPGDWVELRGELMPPPAPAAPGAFDFQRQSYFRGLGGVGFAYGKVRVTPGNGGSGWSALAVGLERLRETLGQRVRATLRGGGTNPDIGAIAAALMTGERGAISEPTMQNMRNSGLAHLLAISGLHVGLVAGIVFFVVRGVLAGVPSLALRQPIKKWAAVAAIAGALGYAQLAGATVPTLRAFLMITLVLAAVLFDRQPISMRPVAWAAAVILLLAPESLLGASFQMSFAAVVALVAVYEHLQGDTAFRRPRGWRAWLAWYVLGVALTTLVAGTATAGFAAYHFNRVAVYGLAANVVAVPVTALWIMPLAVAAYALMPFGLEALALQPLGWGVAVVMATADTVAHWPGAVRQVAAMPAWGLVALVLGGLWAALWQGPLRRWGFVVLAVGVTSSWAERPPDVLVSADGRLAAVREADGGYGVSDLRRAAFERDVWLRRAGLSTATGRWPRAGRAAQDAGDDSPVQCDALGCWYQSPPGPGSAGVTFAFVRSAEALAEDCPAADVTVVLEAHALAGVGACPPGTRLITPNDLARLGAHAFWVEGGKIRLDTVNARRGRRPWVLTGR